jgi:hypothetical protein
MKVLVIVGFIVGAVPFAAGFIYYVIDYQRTGRLYRKKVPWMPIMAAGGLIAVASLAVGIAVSHGGPLF